MSERQFLTLFVCNLVLWTIGYGITPLLPVQVAGMGAGQALAGGCMALSQLAMVAGTVSAGWLSGRFRQGRVPALVAGSAFVPALWLMGRATTPAGLAAAMTVSFYCAGIVLASNSITAGLCARGNERGKVFGLLALTVALGALAGGGLAGPLASRWGYAAMYSVLALMSMLAPLSGLLWEEGEAAPALSSKATTVAMGAGLGRSFYLLFAASLGASVAGFVLFAGRSFVMASLGYDTAALTTAGAIGGAVALPVPLLAGWLSDRLGRKRFMALSFVTTTAGLLALSASTALWHFWAASMLFTLANACGPASSALVTDLVPRESLGRGLAIFNSATWLGGIVGCALAGLGAQTIGMTATLLAAACLPVIAVGLLAAAGPHRHRQGALSLPSENARSGPLPATA